MTLIVYLSRFVGARMLAVWAVLVSLGVSIDLIRSATDLIEIGGAAAMANYAFLRAPQIMVTIFPVAMLVGSTMAFMTLSNRSEVVIIRASGYGIFRVLRLLLPLAIIMGVAYSQLADRLNSWSEINLAKSFPKTEKAAKVGAQIWTRDSRQIIRAHLGSTDGTLLKDLAIFEVNRAGLVKARRNAGTAKFSEGSWWLDDVTRIQGNETITEPAGRWQTVLTPESVSEISLESTQVSTKTARAALAGLAVSTRSKSYYVTRIARSYASFFVPIIMITLAALAGFGNARSGNAFRPAAIAITLGFAYVAADGLFGSLGEVGVIEANLAAFTPTVAFAMIGTWSLLHLE